MRYDRSTVPTIVLAAMLFVVPACAPPSAGVPGTVIANARVVDGTGGPSQQIDVRIEGERIAEIGDLTPHPEDIVVDADGLTLAPGFIDPHSHHDGGLLDEMPDARAVVSQGATTIVVGQDGGQQYPLAEFFGRLEDTPVAVNVASYAGHGRIRGRVMGDDYMRPSTPDELQQMEALLRSEMQAGALGLGSGLEYDPGSFSTPDEVVALAKVAAGYGGRYISHFRSEDQYFWEALDEIINIGREAELPVQVSHIKLAMPRWWGQTDRLLGILDEARASGVDITVDIYPYPAWQTGFRWLLTVFPDRDPDSREGADYVLQEMLSPQGVLLANYPAQPEYNGLTVAEIAEQRGADPATTLMSLLKADVEFAQQGGESRRSSMLGFAMDEPDIEAIMQWPLTVICSDGGLAGAHPRGYGTFTRFLGHYVRDRGIMSLEEGVHKITALTAQHLGIVDRGTIEEGAYADLVLFDPDTVIDRSTVVEPHLTSAGIDTVWVNGQIAYESGETTDNRPGMPLRRATGGGE
ncbi:MAG TPA: D-aminoacylase [Acidobacteriota bacterium]|nr:D-aminoacylase [Acidobacteriota bacterium]